MLFKYIIEANALGFSGKDRCLHVIYLIGRTSKTFSCHNSNCLYPLFL